MPQESHVPWWYRSPEGRVGHYLVKTDLAPPDAETLAGHLNLMHDEYARRLASLPARAPAPLNVWIFAREIDYLDTMESRLGIDAAGTGGMFVARPNLSALAFWSEGLPPRRVRHVLRHEGFHQFAWSRFGGDLPMWLDEGLAELFGQAIVAGRTVIVGAAPASAVEDVQAAIESEAFVPFREMLAMSAEDWSDAVRDGDGGRLYRQAWSMVHYLAYGEGGRHAERFRTYLVLLNRGFPPGDAFVRAFDTEDVDAFEQGWRTHARTLRPSPLATAVERLEFLAEGALSLDRRETEVGSLDELRAALRATGFTRTVVDRTGETVQRPQDAMFRIPFYGTPDLEQRPVFVVSRPKPFNATRRDRRLDELDPLPPSIGTRFLKPREAEVRWIRTEGGMTYDVVVE